MTGPLSETAAGGLVAAAALFTATVLPSGDGSTRSCPHAHLDKDSGRVLVEVGFVTGLNSVAAAIVDR